MDLMDGGLPLVRTANRARGQRPSKPACLYVWSALGEAVWAEAFASQILDDGTWRKRGCYERRRPWADSASPAVARTPFIYHACLLFVYLFVCLSVCLFICLSVCLSVYLFACQSVCLRVGRLFQRAVARLPGWALRRGSHTGGRDKASACGPNNHHHHHHHHAGEADMACSRKRSPQRGGYVAMWLCARGRLQGGVAVGGRRETQAALALGARHELHRHERWYANVAI
jgi:hypothetical protein